MQEDWIHESVVGSSAFYRWIYTYLDFRNIETNSPLKFLFHDFFCSLECSPHIEFPSWIFEVHKFTNLCIYKSSRSNSNLFVSSLYESRRYFPSSKIDITTIIDTYWLSELSWYIRCVVLCLCSYSSRTSNESCLIYSINIEFWKVKICCDCDFHLVVFYRK